MTEFPLDTHVLNAKKEPQVTVKGYENGSLKKPQLGDTG